MGVLKTLTNEYFGISTRKEDEIPIGDLPVEIVSFTDKNNVFHKKGFKVLDDGYNYMNKTMAKTLKTLIDRIIEKRGNECSLNDIDVSNIIFTSYNADGLFEYSDFNGDISGWDVSNMREMFMMFHGSKFTGKNGMFRLEKGNKVETMLSMFNGSSFEADINDWVVNSDCEIRDMFYNTPLEKNNKLPKWYK